MRSVHYEGRCKVSNDKTVDDNMYQSFHCLHCGSLLKGWMCGKDSTHEISDAAHCCDSGVCRLRMDVVLFSVTIVNDVF